LTALTLVSGLLIALWRWIVNPIRKKWLADRDFQEQFREDWHGVDKRPGVAGRPGVMQILEELGTDSTTTQERLLRLEQKTELNALALQELRGQVNTLDSVITSS
jgi:hypothetical protein